MTDTARPSKSAAKREAKRIEELAGYLIALSEEQRRALALDPALLEAAQFAASRQRGAARRERLRLAKTLRSEPDAVAIIDAARANAESLDSASRRLFRQVEQLRDGVFDGTVDIDTEARLSADERTAVAELLRRFQSTQDARERKHCYREAFRLLRSALARDLGTAG